MTSNNPQTGLHVGLIKGAEFFVSKMEQKIDSEKSLSSKIKEATSTGSPVVESNRGHIDITIDSSKDGPAPMAAAFEYGSGIHGEEGEKYKITHKEVGKALQIPRGRWEKFNPPPDQDPLYFMGVMHPGVKAVPYIYPTIVDNKKEIAKIIGREFVASISLGGKVTIIE